MGVIQSIFCSVTFCMERVLTWTCCAFLLILLMFTIIVLMVYGITVGYNYAQKELASFSMTSRTTTEANMLRMGGAQEPDMQPIVRLLAVNRSQYENAPPPALEMYTQTPAQHQLYLESQATALVVLETERPPQEPNLSPKEKELARKLIGRFRRSKPPISSVVTTMSTPFFRPLKNSTVAAF